MNVKILFFPLSITIALAISVFYIKPEIDAMMTARGASLEKEQFASVAAQKVQNVQDLKSNLDTNKENESVVFHYLPNTRDDDRIVDGIGFLSSQSGLALTSVRIETAVVEAVVDKSLDVAPVESDVVFSQSADITSVSVAPVVAVKPKMVSVSVEAVGSYESIRDAIAKFSHEDRFQEFTSVDIKRVAVVGQSAAGQPAQTSDVLNASLTMNFTYLPNVKAQGNFNRSILAQNKFDFDIVQKLKQYTSASVPAIEVGASGTVNPFVR